MFRPVSLVQFIQTLEKKFIKEKNARSIKWKILYSVPSQCEMIKCPDDTRLSQSVMRNSCLTMLISY